MDIFLYVVFFYWGTMQEYRFEMPDMETCIATIASSSSDYSIGAENEAGHVMFCATEKAERQYNSTWWTDKRGVVAK